MISLRFSVLTILVLSFAMGLPTFIVAQTRTATINTGNNPFAMAVNPATNKIYIVNNGSATITIVDGANNITTSANAGVGPAAVAINPSTNKIYVANEGGTVTVIDGTNNATASVNAGFGPVAVAVNSVTNKIYVANEDGTVTVIDGSNNTTTSINAGMGPSAVAINPITNKIYVVNEFSNNVTVVDGVTNNTTTALVGHNPVAIAVNPVTNKIYVANQGSNSLSVINGSDNLAITVPVGVAPAAVAINPVTNKIYVADEGSNEVTVIDGTNNSSSTIAAGNQPVALAVNIVNNRIYAANFNSANVTVIDGSNNAVAATIGTGNSPRAVAVNPITNKIYAANQSDNSVTVVDGATNQFNVFPASAPLVAAVNPVTNKIYMTNPLNNTVTVVDGASNTTSTITDPNFDYPSTIAINPMTNKIYVSNANSSNLTVIDGTNNTTTEVNVGFQPSPIAINPVTNKIYELQDNGVAVIDGTTNAVTNTAAGFNIFSSDLSVNPVTNKVYVVGGSGNTVSGTNMIVIDGASNNGISIGDSFDIFESVAVNPVTNKIYATRAFPTNDVTVIDGNNYSMTRINLGNIDPFTLALNPVTNKIYVLGSGKMMVIDGGNNTTTTIDVGIGGCSVTVNPVTNKIYVFKTDPIYGNAVTVVDGATNTIITNISINVSNDRHALGVNPFTNTIYAPGVDSMLQGDFTVINEQQVQPIPLTTSITPLPNNQFAYPGTLTFNFTTSSAYSPITPLVQNVFFQFDTWQGTWIQASGTAPNFTGIAPALLPGVHTLYAYAADALQGDSVQAGNGNEGQSSPLVGAITAYLFVILPSNSSTTLMSSANSAIFGQPITFTATVTSGAGTPTGTVTFADGTTLLGTATVNGSGQATLTSPTAGAGARSIVAYYNGDGRIAASTSAPVMETISQASSTTTVVSDINPSIYGQVLTFSATVTPQFGGTPTGTVTFKDGSTDLAVTNLPPSGQTHFFEIIPLSRGAHSITASYSGDGNITSSTSTGYAQIINPATTTTTVIASFPRFFRSTKTLNATVTPQIHGIPTGLVTFMDGASQLGTAALDGSGHAVFNINQLTIGKHTFGVIYGGDSNFTGCTSPDITVYRSPAPQFVP